MGDDGTGVDTPGAEAAGGALDELAYRYAGLVQQFQTAIRFLSDVCVEPAVIDGVDAYGASQVGVLASLQEATSALAEANRAAAGAARAADRDIGTGYRTAIRV